MKISSLALQNIGPFIEAELDFCDNEKNIAPVTLITGENGTGKSIILDALRGMFGNLYGVILGRDIRRRQAKKQSNIKFSLFYQNSIRAFNAKQIEKNYITDNIYYPFLHNEEINFVFDYWPTNLAAGNYEINMLTAPNHDLFLNQALSGNRNKTDVTNLICHLDYVRDSRDPVEKALGEKLFSIVEKIISASLLEGGKLSHVSRSTYEPVIEQNGQLVNLSNLSSGNSYLIQNMLSLLQKMYSFHLIKKAPLEELCQTPGFLLIDEAENQLHPKWQKRFLSSILKIFPNIQIIATTHSPYIISSVSKAKLFVCKSKGNHCVVEDVTAEYSNKPVDEILMSPLFEETQPFNETITKFLEKRKQAIEIQNKEEQSRIEDALKLINPEYFSYFDIDEMLSELNGED